MALRRFFSASPQFYPQIMWVTSRRAMTGPESVPICQSLSWWKIMQTAESLAIKGVQRVFLRSCTELSTAHGDSCRGVEEFTHRVLMESRGKRLAWQGHRRCTMSGFALPKARGKSLSGREDVRRITCWQGIGLPNAAGNLFRSQTPRVR